jgi:mannose-P-dolichol utilization defect protein 1
MVKGNAEVEKVVFDFLENCPLKPIANIAQWPTQCFQSLISKFVGTAILLGSVAVKLPQVFNIVNTKNVVGLSPSAFYSEVPVAILSVIYSYRLGYAFTSYGESVMILIQNLILVYLLWIYMQPMPSVMHKLLVIIVFSSVAVTGFYMPAEFLYLLPNINLALMMYSRVAQIVNNIREDTTGPLSSITMALTFLGSVARIFTTYTEAGGDILLVAGFGSSALLSGILLAQIFYYNNKAGKTKKQD